MKVNLKSWKVWCGVIIAVPLGILFSINVGLVQMLPLEAERPLIEATSVTLYSLDDQSLDVSPHEASEGLFHSSYPILGSVVLEGADARKAAKAFLNASEFWMPGEFGCFMPHHALRIVLAGHVYDYLLCYMCDALAVYSDGKEITYQNARGSPDVLNSLLTAAHVPLTEADDPDYVAHIQARAEKGETWAQMKLSTMYYRGNRVKKDKAVAMQWLRKAAEKDNGMAEFELGEAYARGDGVPHDPVEASFWRALGQGEFGPDYTGLTSAQEAQVKKRVQEWRAAHPSKVERHDSAHRR